MKYTIIILALLLLAPVVFSACAPDLCIINRDDSIVTPNVDINFLNSTEHDGVATHDFDVNISIRNPDGSFHVKDFSATKGDINGEWFYFEPGGFSTEGSYKVYWDAEHQIEGVGDGIVDFELVSFSIATIDINITEDINVNIITRFCEISSSVNENEDRFYFSSDITDLQGNRIGLNPTISFFNQKFDYAIFENKKMEPGLKGNYVFSIDMILENGFYSYLVESDSNCSKSFNMTVSDKPDIIGFDSIAIEPEKKRVSDSGSNILTLLFENPLIIDIFFLALLIGGIYHRFFRKK